MGCASRTGHICLRDVELVASLWDVIRVQGEVRVGCQQRFKLVGWPAGRTDVGCLACSHEVPERCHERFQVGG